MRFRGHVATPKSGRRKVRDRSRTYFFTFAHRFFWAAQIIARAAADIILLPAAFGAAVLFNDEIAGRVHGEACSTSQSLGLLGL
jgi:hypothetical protein